MRFPLQAPKISGPYSLYWRSGFHSFIAGLFAKYVRQGTRAIFRLHPDVDYPIAFRVSTHDYVSDSRGLSVMLGLAGRRYRAGCSRWGLFLDFAVLYPRCLIKDRWLHPSRILARFHLSVSRGPEPLYQPINLAAMSASLYRQLCDNVMLAHAPEPLTEASLERALVQIRQFKNDFGIRNGILG